MSLEMIFWCKASQISPLAILRRRNRRAEGVLSGRPAFMRCGAMSDDFGRCGQHMRRREGGQHGSCSAARFYWRLQSRFGIGAGACDDLFRCLFCTTTSSLTGRIISESLRRSFFAN